MKRYTAVRVLTQSMVEGDIGIFVGNDMRRWYESNEQD